VTRGEKRPTWRREQGSSVGMETDDLTQGRDEEPIPVGGFWETGWVIVTDLMTANTLAACPETADEIPAFYEAERTFSEHHLALIVYYSSGIKSQRGKPNIVSATVHWVSSHILPEAREPLAKRGLN